MIGLIHLNTTTFSNRNYSYGFNGMEKDDAVKGAGNSYDFGARIYDSRLGRWLAIDPYVKKYPYHTPYMFAANAPIIFIDPNGKDIVIAFQGGFQLWDGAEKIDNGSAGTTGKFVQNLVDAAVGTDVNVKHATYANGVSCDDGVNMAMTFIKENYESGEKIVIYGYSYGGDAAVELAQKLRDEGYTVDLLITVDAADGPAKGTTVDRTIPDNVKKNLNEYQTTSSPMGSRGDKNTKEDSESETEIDNVNVTKENPNVHHGSIDELMLEKNTNEAKSVLNLQQKKNSETTVTDGGSSRTTTGSSQDSSSSSSSSFNDSGSSSTPGSSSSSQGSSESESQSSY